MERRTVAFANVAIGQAEPKGLKSITTSQIEQLRQEQKQESHTSNIRRQNIDASYGLNYTKGKHAFGIEGSLYGNLNSKSQREIDIQTALKDVVSTSQVEINEVPKVFSNSLTANYFLLLRKERTNCTGWQTLLQTTMKPNRIISFINLHHPSIRNI